MASVQRNTRVPQPSVRDRHPHQMLFAKKSYRILAALLPLSALLTACDADESWIDEAGEEDVTETDDSEFRASNLRIGNARATDILALGSDHTCALRGDGSVYCWGANNNGQLGLGTFTTGTSTPSAVTGLNGDVVSITAGAGHSCALLGDGTVECWGDNLYGQLGVGDNADKASATAVVNLTDVVALAGGYHHTCATKADGTLWCWGAGSTFQLGQGTNDWADHNTPVQVMGLNGPAIDVATGTSFSCALLGDRTVQCWGNNLNGKLGAATGNTTYSATPVTVSGVSDVTDLSASQAHTCAVIADGRIQCWGMDEDFRLGATQTAPLNPAPSASNPVIVTTTLETPAVAVSATIDGTCALLANGTMKCWGANGNGQLGIGSTSSNNDGDPTQVQAVSGIANATAVAGASNHGTFCAALADGTVTCWGWGASGQLGQTMYFPFYTSTPVGVPSTDVKGVRRGAVIAAGNRHSCSVTYAGKVLCTGADSVGELGDNRTNFSAGTYTRNSTHTNGAYHYVKRANGSGGFVDLSDVVQVSAGYLSTCALTAKGEVWCWGFGGPLGQVNDGLSKDHAVRVQKQADSQPLSNAVSVAMGTHHACALIADGTAYCWGHGSAGKLGDGASLTRNGAVQVVSQLNPLVYADDFIAITAGAASTCALTSAGGVRCWGSDADGQLGNGVNGSSSVPVNVNVLSNVATLAQGAAHVCAATGIGEVYCWGSNISKQCGQININPLTQPTKVQASFNNVHIVALSLSVYAGTSTCGVDSDGQLWCWGLAHCGNAASCSNSATPAIIGVSSDVVGVAVGSYHTCAILNDGATECWGDGQYGALGDESSLIGGGYPDSATPVTSSLEGPSL